MKKWERNGWLAKNEELTEDNLKEGVRQLIKANDPESTTLGKEMIRLKIEDKLIEGLNPDQTTAFINIIEFIRTNDHEGMVLKGYAGTGKTFLVKRVIEYITNAYPYRRIAITAPTNKAVEVLVRNAPFADASNMMEDTFNGDEQLVYTTIHSLLGMREEIDEKGNRKFIADPRSKKKGSIYDFKYLIVDEVSMLSDDIYNEVMKFNDKLKIIFMGDPAQIPPVNKVDCLPFTDAPGYNLKYAELKQIMRQKGDNAIVDYSMTLRENLTVGGPLLDKSTKMNKKGDGVIFINGKDPEDRKNVRKILTEYYTSPEYGANPDYMRTIAWKNATVNGLNKIIRGIKFGDNLPTFVPGDHLVANGPIFRESQYGNYTIEFTTSEEFIVKDVNIMERELYHSMENAPTIKFTGKYYVISTSDGPLYVLHEDDRERFNKEASSIRRMALVEKNKYMWVQYYTFLKWTDNVIYNYAITAHKSQGSTYDNVLLFEEDLDKNNKIVERNRIKYTGYTRAKHKLYVLR